MRQKQEPDISFKILILGDRAVGKTTLLQKFVNELDPDCYYATCGVDQKLNSLRIFNKQINLKIWDATGDPTLWNLVKRYLPDTNSALICFDVTNPFSLNNVRAYVEKLREVQPNVPIMLIGCKSDLTHRRMVSVVQAQQMAQQLGIAYLETSGLKKNNVDETFIQITQRMYFAVMLHNIRPTLEKYFNNYLNNSSNPISKREITLKKEWTLLFGHLFRATSPDELNDFFKATLSIINKADALFAKKHPIWSSITASPLSLTLKKILSALDTLQKSFQKELNINESEPLSDTSLTL
ncbi:GTP-binding protein [Legionella fallonii]|uniref:Ras family GTPase n=1 Tax=Legionella fallonii LLAP-10 TaxID=1212491 RepID=A0A098G715_9GAMM|nr:GTP-binding protein [Legionella fallonii]CEG57290.1 conserved protein of unknown function [ras domain] [Legionella fallonii LLAP-10]